MASSAKEAAALEEEQEREVGSSSYRRRNCCFLCMKPDCSSFCPHCRRDVAEEDADADDGKVYFCGPAHYRHHREKYVKKKSPGTEEEQQDRKKDVEPPAKCFPFAVSRSPESGRCLVATRDIRPQELIMRNEPLVAGPAVSVAFPRKADNVNKDYVICVECFETLNLNAASGAENAVERCRACDLPMCTVCVKGRGLTYWHRIVECDVLVRMKFSPASDVSRLLLQISALTAFRLHLNDDQVKTEKLEWALATKPTRQEQEIAKVLVDDFQVPPDAAERCLRLLRRNAKSLDGVGSGNGTALYPVFSLVNHSCGANTKVAVGAGTKMATLFAMEARAAVPIKAGEQITVRYLPFSLWEPEISEQFMEKWEFKCNCPICSKEKNVKDAVNCQTCPVQDASKNNLMYYIKGENGGKCSWKCDVCGTVKVGREAAALRERLFRVAEAVKNDKDKNKKSAERLLKGLGAAHTIVANAKLHMLMRSTDMNNQGDVAAAAAEGQGGRQGGGEGGGGVKKEDVKKKEDDDEDDVVRWRRELNMCEDVLAHLDDHDRGLTRSRGLVLCVRANLVRRLANREAKSLKGESAEAAAAAAKEKMLAAAAAESHVYALEAAECLAFDGGLSPRQIRLRRTASYQRMSARLLLHLSKPLVTPVKKLTDLRTDLPERLRAKVAAEREWIEKILEENKDEK